MRERRREMKKTVIKVIVAAIILFFLSFPASVLAASNVVFEGESDRFVFIPGNKDLFQNFKGMLPGERRTQQVVVKNNSLRTLDYYMKVVNHPDLNDGLDVYREELMNLMLINMNFSNGLSYSGTFKDATTTNNVNNKEKYKEGYFYLTTLGPGQSMNIDLELYAPGTTFDLRFNNLAVYIDWHFYVEEDQDSVIVKIPQTGGELILVAGGIILATGIMVILKNKKGREDA